MITDVLSKLFGTANQRKINSLKPIVEKINALEPDFEKLSDDELKNKTLEFRDRLGRGATLDGILPEAFAAVREASKRTLGMRHFDVQLMGGMVLNEGKIAEMKTGEGKTLTATLPLYLNALTGKGSHLVTVNDYLAKRDAEWMSPIYNALGMTVGIIQNSMHDHKRKLMYACDIVYATNNELGFDYLRDNMKFRLEDYAQRELNFAIVDEVDSILIDEARTPLIISGSTEESSKLYQDVDKAVSKLKKDIDFEVDEKFKSVQMTEEGNDKIEKFFNIENLYALENIQLLHHVTQALKAYALFKKDVEYVVRDGEVLIVDEFTGRILPGRRYSDGLHQAIEAKEGVTIEQESQTLASITLQNFFRLYNKLAGMTGTALTEAEEFHKIYGLDVVAIPPNRPMIRQDKPDLIFFTKGAKYKAIAEDVKDRHKKNQPVLIGTISVETSELLSNILTSQGIPHSVLNAKYHEKEAEIVEHAGAPGKVTIATNMAGRGTDIKLTEESKNAGGLYILGTERHESRRIDNQLRGRSGRQGDPGESRFYLSLEDDLIRVFAGETFKQRMAMFGMKEDEIIESGMVSRAIEKSQEKVEKFNFENRKNVLEYDDILNQHRKVIYRYRRDVLDSDQDVYEIVKDFISGCVSDIVTLHCPKRDISKEALDSIIESISNLTSLNKEELLTAGISTSNSDALKTDLTNLLLEKYTMLRNRLHSDILKEAEKWILLETIDKAWKQHMLNIDHLKEGISLRSWGQKNPLVEYKREAFFMFKDMMNQIRYEVVNMIFHLNVEHFDKHDIEQRREKELEDINLHSGHEQETKQAESKNEPGRNEPCHCGSGKKFKKCHGA